MAYRWDDFHLDREGTLLTRGGRHVHVSRKILDCITYLLDQRERVVPYDELIHAIWSHRDVGHAQLSQVVRAARSAIGDDGRTQRLIRNFQGIGYRWIGEALICDVEVAVPAAAMETQGKTPTESHDPTSRPHEVVAPPEPPGDGTAAEAAAAARTSVARRVRPIHLALVAGVLLLIGLASHQRWRSDAAPSPPAPSLPGNAPLAALERALYAGEFDAVRQGLATLPPRIAESPDARILEIELDLYRGRFERAEEKIDAQLARPEAIADPILRARLFILKSKAGSRLGKPSTETFALAQSALDLLDAAGASVPPAVRGRALERRAISLFEQDRLDPALRDLGMAVPLFERSGHDRAATDARSNIARIWMRTGRLGEALDAMQGIADRYRRSSDMIGELHARNTLTRIQMELLRWDDALASSDRAMQLLREIPEAERRHRALELRAQVLTAQGRLRLAASQLDEASLAPNRRSAYIIPAYHRLESGNAEGAMRDAAKAFDLSVSSPNQDILLDENEGALLIWVIAAQRSTAGGERMPLPSAEAQRLLQHPKRALSRIARGRWLWSQGRLREAESELRRAFDETRAVRHLFRMTLAADALVGVQLQRGAPEDAGRVLDALRRMDPRHVERDYHYNLMRLRVALAKRDGAMAADARRRVDALAGERRLPPEIARAYAAPAARMRLPRGPGPEAGAP